MSQLFANDWDVRDPSDKDDYMVERTVNCYFLKSFAKCWLVFTFKHCSARIPWLSRDLWRLWNHWDQCGRVEGGVDAGEVTELHVEEKILVVPVVKMVGVPVLQDVQKVVAVPQVQFFDRVVDVPGQRQRQVPMVQEMLKTCELHKCSSRLTESSRCQCTRKDEFLWWKSLEDGWDFTDAAHWQIVNDPVQKHRQVAKIQKV